MSDLVICNKCNWVHFSISRKHAEAEVRKFNRYYKSAPKKAQQCFGGPSSVASYEYCFTCGNSYKNFSKPKKADIPFGSTIQPIIRKQD